MSRDFGSGGSSLVTDFTPTDCAPRTGPAGGNCTSIYVSTVEEICLLSAGATCAAGHESYETAGSQAGFAWGIFLSLFGDVIISIGLALQKVAHNRIEKQVKERARDTSSQRGLSDASSDGLRGEDPKPSFVKMPVWWAGILATVGGEVCNFAAYGDTNTPASVVTAVGCVGVIANAIIATFFLGEVFRRRDGLGIALVLAGVILIVSFAPQQTRTLSAPVMADYLRAPGAISYLVLLLLAITALAFLCPRVGHRHVLWHISMASLLGSLTVLASKAVSTFAVQVRAASCPLPCCRVSCMCPATVSTAAVRTPCADPRGHRNQLGRRPG